MQITKQAQTETNLGLEELAFEICQDNIMSGEAFWTLVSCYAEAKLAQVRGEVI